MSSDELDVKPSPTEILGTQLGETHQKHSVVARHWWLLCWWIKAIASSKKSQRTGRYDSLVKCVAAMRIIATELSFLFPWELHRKDALDLIARVFPHTEYLCPVIMQSCN